MLDVHASHKSIHTWKDFLIHIATICVGLLIAVALEQTVEAIHHHHQREQLLVSLNHDTRATLRDTGFIIDEYHRRMQWSRARIEQVQVALDSHKPLAQATPDERALITIPADPAWEAARASGMIPLFSQGEVRLESPGDLQVYLDLLIADEGALESSRFMAAVIRGAEAAVLEGARNHDRIEDSEIATLKSLPK